jgi:hypothetical protein
VVPTVDRQSALKIPKRLLLAATCTGDTHPVTLAGRAGLGEKE